MFAGNGLYLHKHSRIQLKPLTFCKRVQQHHYVPLLIPFVGGQICHPFLFHIYVVFNSRGQTRLAAERRMAGRRFSPYSTRSIKKDKLFPYSHPHPPLCSKQSRAIEAGLSPVQGWHQLSWVLVKGPPQVDQLQNPQCWLTAIVPNAPSGDGQGYIWELCPSTPNTSSVPEQHSLGRFHHSLYYTIPAE